MFKYIFHPFCPFPSFFPPLSHTHTHVFQKRGPKAQNKITHPMRAPERARVWITDWVDDTTLGAFQRRLADLQEN